MKKCRPILNPPASPRWGFSAIKKISIPDPLLDWDGEVVKKDPYLLWDWVGEVIYVMVAERRGPWHDPAPPVLAGGTPTPGPWRALASGWRAGRRGLAAGRPVMFFRLAGAGPAGVLPTIKTR